MKTLRILAIDDHEMTMLGYKFILEGIEFDGHNIIVDTATSYHTGKKLIEDSVNFLRPIPFFFLLGSKPTPSSVMVSFRFSSTD